MKRPTPSVCAVRMMPFHARILRGDRPWACMTAAELRGWMTALSTLRRWGAVDDVGVTPRGKEILEAYCVRYPDFERLTTSCPESRADAADAPSATPRCDWRAEHDPITDRPTGAQCGAPATHRIVWLDGSRRFSYGCAKHLDLDADATAHRVEPLPPP